MEWKKQTHKPTNPDNQPPLSAGIVLQRYLVLEMGEGRCFGNSFSLLHFREDWKTSKVKKKSKRKCFNLE